jgi:hypothetical protein
VPFGEIIFNNNVIRILHIIDWFLVNVSQIEEKIFLQHDCGIEEVLGCCSVIQ